MYVYLANLMGFTWDLPSMFHCFLHPPVVSQEKPSAAKEQELKQQASRARLEAQASRQEEQSKARQASISSTSEPAGVAGATGR